MISIFRRTWQISMIDLFWEYVLLSDIIRKYIWQGLRGLQKTLKTIRDHNFLRMFCPLIYMILIHLELLDFISTAI